MKLDANALRYLSRDDFRVLTAVEIGMKNHELVPVPLVLQIAGLRMGGVNKILSTLLRYKLLHHDRQHFDGYRLTYLGYDFLAMRTLLARGVLAGVGRQIGVGKESDIFVVENDEGEQLCMKFHRLGRTSFRQIKNKRDYHGKRGSPSWLYLSRLAAMKEFAFMKVLREEGFPVPKPVDANRHTILMSLVQGYNLQSVRKLEEKYVESIYVDMMSLIERFARYGLIHGDFNEFNIMVNDEAELTVIDFPQMVSIRHPNARMYFERDVNCVSRFFRKRFNFFHEKRPDFDECVRNQEKSLDVQVAASGWSYKMSKELDRFVTEAVASDDESDAEDDEEYAPVLESANLDESAVLAEEHIKDATSGAAGEEQGAESLAQQQQQQQEGQEALNSGNTNGKIQVTTKFGVVEVATKTAELDSETVKLATTEKNSSADEEEQVEEGEEQEEPSEAAKQRPSDAPDAYLAHDYVSQRSTASVRRTPGMDDIRRRVRRDFSRKQRRGGGGGSGSLKRNVVKSKDKRAVANDIKAQGEWL